MDRVPDFPRPSDEYLLSEVQFRFYKEAESYRAEAWVVRHRIFELKFSTEMNDDLNRSDVEILSVTILNDPMSTSP